MTEHWEPFDSVWSQAYVCEPQVCALQSTVSRRMERLVAHRCVWNPCAQMCVETMHYPSDVGGRWLEYLPGYI